MKFIVILISLLVWLTPATAWANSSNLKLTTKEIQELQQAQCSLKTIEELVSEGIISTTEAKNIQTDYLAKFKNILPPNIDSSADLDEVIKNVGDSQGFWQSIQGVFSFAKIIAIFSSFLLTIALGWLASLYLIPLLKLIPLAVYEVLVYLVCVGAISTGYWIGADYIQYITLSACLGLIGALGFSYGQHKSFYRQLKEKIGIDAFSLDTLLLFLVWSAVAIVYQNVLIGFLAIIALEAFCGFSIVVMPLTYFIGFRHRDAIARTMLISLILLIAELTVKISDTNLPYFDIFAPGMRFMGTFVYFLGLLIVSSKWYYSKNSGRYLLMQGLTIVSGIIAFYIGSVWQISQLQGIGGTLFVLYILEKYFELPWSRKTFAWAALGLSLLLYGCAWLISSYPELFVIKLS